MPAVRSVSCGVALDMLLSSGARKQFTAADIPASFKTTTAKAEQWINSWLTANVTECQCVAHVFSVAPLLFTVWCGEIGTAVPVNWWVG